MAHEGGCYCGALRYRADDEPLRIFHCHCTICRRVQGAPVVTWITFPTAGWSWTKGTPAKLKSTPEATRYFCRDCGTRLCGSSVRRPAMAAPPEPAPMTMYSARMGGASGERSREHRGVRDNEIGLVRGFAEGSLATSR